MCGRFTLTTEIGTNLLASLFDSRSKIDDLSPRYNIAPKQTTAAVLVEREERVLDKLQWGLLPPWFHDRRVTNPLINARAETLESRPSFRDSFEKRRCLIPSDGFYEWVGQDRIPYWISLRERRPFAYAGLYELRKNHSSTDFPTFAIITTKANNLMRTMHNRMPAIIPPEYFDQWLNPKKTASESRLLLRPYPAAKMITTQVSRLVNNVNVDKASCILPVPPMESQTSIINFKLFAEDLHE